MNKTLVAVMVLLFGCGIVFAQQDASQGGGQEQMQGGKENAKKAEKFSGIVKSVDAETMKITVTDKKGTSQEFTAGPSSEIHKAGATANFSDIMEGDKVTVFYTGTMDNPEVQRIRVQSGKAKGKGDQGGMQQNKDKGSQGGAQGGSEAPAISTGTQNGNK